MRCNYFYILVGEARQALERNGTTKSQDSLRDDDSLTSLEWLSALGNPTSASLLPPPTEPQKQNNPKDLILLAFRLGRQPVSFQDSSILAYS